MKKSKKGVISATYMGIVAMGIIALIVLIIVLISSVNHSKQLGSLIDNLKSDSLSEAQMACLKEKGIDPLNLPKTSTLGQTPPKTLEDIETCLKLK